MCLCLHNLILNTFFSRESDSTTTNVRSSVRPSVRPSVTKTPYQPKIIHFTLPQHSPSLTPSHTTSQNNITSQHHTQNHTHCHNHHPHHHPFHLLLERLLSFSACYFEQQIVFVFTLDRIILKCTGNISRENIISGVPWHLNVEYISNWTHPGSSII